MKRQVDVRDVGLVVLTLAALLVFGMIVQADEGITNFTGVHIDGTLATATPAFMVNADGAGAIAEFRSSGTPVARITSGGISSLVGGLSGSAGVDGALNVENMVLPSVSTKSFTYTAAAGATYNGFIFPAGEKILVHSVLVNVTTNFDATGDDATMVVGDANDADGYIVLADAELQAADTEGTGFAAGWQGLAAATLGAYLDLNHNSFPVVAPTGGYTITYALDESSGDTLAGGAATIYLIYSRLE